ncbi:MAG TPA: HEAT repeat domain-containing protein [Thermoguttaceae bacterium]|nr:HEAT repeat domain-containing protein [Thermoguttaceae bacterium]
MAVSEQLKQLVDQMPDADSRGMYTTDIDKDKIEKAVAEIAKGGRENVLGLVEMLGEPGSEEDVKPHYALHCVANHALIAGDERARKELAETLAGQLSNPALWTYNRAFLCQELQWVGHGEASAALGALLLDEDLVEPATMALTAIRDGAAEQFRAALPRAQGKCRLNVVQGLGAVEDRQSVRALQQALGDADREVRLAAGWGLSRMGDAGSVDALLKAADVEPGWERVEATKHCLVLAEKLAAAGGKDQAAKIYSHLRDTRKDPTEKYVREAAEKALAGA